MFVSSRGDRVVQVVHHAIATAFEIDLEKTPLTMESVLMDLPGATSLGMVRALTLIEDALTADLYDGTSEHIRTVGELCALVRAKHAVEER